MKVRPARDQDRAALTALHISQDLESFKEAPDVMKSLRLTELSSRSKDIILVAEDEGELVAYFWAVALRLFDYRIGILFYVYVEPGHRRRGIGRQLTERGMEILHEMGVRRYWVNTEFHITPTVEILESLGFSQNTAKVFYQKVEPGAKHEWEKV